MESNTSALELLTSDLINKDEALFINKATRDINKNNKSFKDMVSLHGQTYFHILLPLQKLEKATSDLLSLPNKRTQQWSKMTQKNVQASQSQ